MQPGKEQQQDQATGQQDGKNKPNQNANVESAHLEADKDIKADPELSRHSKNDDLDEGETARLGDGKNELI